MIRLVIADDHPVVREGLRRIASEHRHIAVVAEVGNGEDLLNRLIDTEADIVLLDISMPGRGFLDVLHRVKSDHPRLRVIVLSVHPEEQYAVRALKSGAAGYVTKDRTPWDLVEAILKVHRGGKYVSPALAERLASDLEMGREGPPHERLSDREFEVLRLLGVGVSIKAIARGLALDPKTISTYRSRIMHKIQLTSNADIVRYVIEHGLEPSPRNM
jgi:DNA-binding NarL/FixJ family response regulator